MGPPGEVELSELDHDRLVDLKSAAGALASEGRHADAVESFTRAIKLSPSALLYAKRADCYLKLKKPNAAIRDCDAALALNPDSAKAFKARGIAHRRAEGGGELGPGQRTEHAGRALFWPLSGAAGIMTSSATHAQDAGALGAGGGRPRHGAPDRL